VGYSLTGDTREQVLFLLHGSGANGKSTFLEVIQALLGEYALQTPAETLVQKQGEGIPNDVARLKGARFVAASETEEGKRLAEGMVKKMTGGDVLTARFLHQEYFEFKPEFKLFLATNHKPLIRGTDHAIWRRIRLIPFQVQIPDAEKDKALPEKLKAERSGILTWALEGCRSWQQEGLSTPAEVLQATEAYRDEMDILKDFLESCCIEKAEAEAKVSDLYAAYVAWCEANGERPLTQRAFGMKLSERGLGQRRTKVARYWVGIGLVEGTER
jgi:putative DNA primase/helicase